MKLFGGNGNDKVSFKNHYLLVFLLGLGLSALIFVPYIILDGGMFIFYGDFNTQQIAYYKVAHEAVRSGAWGWSSVSDLGTTFVGSYSFYLLGSPFFWITVPFPSSWIPYFMGPLLMMKIALATLTSYMFLKRYVKNPNYAVVGSLIYAFSGFSIYSIYFNNFHEAMIVLPLLLFSLDEYMEKRTKGLFAFTIFLCCITNYYFFVGQVIFTGIYFVTRILAKSWKISFKEFMTLFLEYTIGMCASAIILVPSVAMLYNNSDMYTALSGWDGLIYTNDQRYLAIIQAFFFMPDLPGVSNFTPESNSSLASLSGWLPLFSMAGVIGWLQLRRKHWLKRLIWVLLIMVFIPVLNASFQLFDVTYYTRWFYMLILAMSLATIMALEDKRVDWQRSIKWTTVITCTIAFAVGLMPVWSESSSTWKIGLETYATRFWTYFAISLMSIVFLVYLFKNFRNNDKKFARNTIIAISIIIVATSSYFLFLGKSQDDEPKDTFVSYVLNGKGNINLDDISNVRSDFYETYDNVGMFWEIPSIQSYMTVVPSTLVEFYETLGITRDDFETPDTSYFALRSLLSTRWLFDEEGDDEYFATENYDSPAMYGWIYYGNANGYDIWENECYIPMGFSYDYYITRTQLEDVSQSKIEQMMLKAIVIEDQDEAYWSQILEPYYLSGLSYSTPEYQADCAQRARTACSEFSYTSSGFEAKYTSEEESIVFFSVPYDDGWTATVNGTSAEIYQVNVGFMAVSVPSGEDTTIVFTYKTPGALTGIVVTICAVIFFLGYISITSRTTPKRVIQKKKSTKRKVRKVKKFSHYEKEHNVEFKTKIRGQFIHRKF